MPQNWPNAPLTRGDPRVAGAAVRQGMVRFKAPRPDGSRFGADCILSRVLSWPEQPVVVSALVHEEARVGPHRTPDPECQKVCHCFVLK